MHITFFFVLRWVESTKSKEEAIKDPTRQNCDSIFFNMSGPSPAHCQVCSIHTSKVLIIHIAK